MINYSIIIPHKNSPDLLIRCLKSIPKRDDIQIIVVDDNSDKKNINYKTIPELQNYNINIIYTTEGKGAGYARNIGLKYAKGNWLIFADADDFFNQSFNWALDYYNNSDADIIYFNVNSVDSETLQECNRSHFLNQYHQTKDEMMFRFKTYHPWAKMIKQRLIFENDIIFSETKAANDVLFSLNIGLHAKKIELCTEKVYCITYRENSLEHIKGDIDIYEARIFISIETNKFYKRNNLPFKDDLYYRYLLRLLTIDYNAFIMTLKKCHKQGIPYTTMFYLMIKRMLKNIIKKCSIKF